MSPSSALSAVPVRLRARGEHDRAHRSERTPPRNRDGARIKWLFTVERAREKLGDKCSIMADANGSYDVAHGIRIGKLIESLNYTFYEEPCPFEEWTETITVRKADDVYGRGMEIGVGHPGDPEGKAPLRARWGGSPTSGECESGSEAMARCGRCKTPGSR